MINGSLKNKIVAVAAGALIGAANGFFGGGGGMIAVPALIFAMKLKNKAAHATAIAVILPVTLISAIVYLANGKFPWGYGSITAVGVTAGGAVGAWLLGRLKSRVVAYIFALVALIAGVRTLFF